MSTKIPSVVSTMITTLLLLMFGSAAMFFLLVALNGFSEREAGPALIASLACQGLGIILSAVAAAAAVHRKVRLEQCPGSGRVHPCECIDGWGHILRGLFSRRPCGGDALELIFML